MARWAAGMGQIWVWDFQIGHCDGWRGCVGAFCLVKLFVLLPWIHTCVKFWYEINWHVQWTVIRLLYRTWSGLGDKNGQLVLWCGGGLHVMGWGNKMMGGDMYTRTSEVRGSWASLWGIFGYFLSQKTTWPSPNNHSQKLPIILTGANNECGQHLDIKDYSLIGQWRRWTQSMCWIFIKLVLVGFPDGTSPHCWMGFGDCWLLSKRLFSRDW